MKETLFEIAQIPAVLYGEGAESVYLFVHGKCGYKEEAKNFAELICSHGWQVLAVDLPEHGQRIERQIPFVPWHVIPELQTVMAYARQRWRRVALRANSIGAWFSMLAFQGNPPEKALFVSPILDMERLIGRMMQWAGVTDRELKARQSIETSFGETLSWQYNQYVKAHPVDAWLCPTSILYAAGDSLTPRQEVDAFAARFHCDLTIMESGEHWFHTPEQLAFLRRWEQTQTVPELSPDECLFFTGRPEELVLYAAFRNRLLTETGETRIKVQKSQITFSGKYGFAYVSHPRRKKDQGILVSFGLSRRQESSRIQFASEPYPNRWTHHILVQAWEEIDDELMGWIREASWFANTK